MPGRLPVAPPGGHRGNRHVGGRCWTGRVHLFGVDIDSVSYLRYDDATGDQFTTLWPDGREFL